MSNCLFCSIVSGDIPCHKVYEDEHTLAFLDIACDYIGHTVVVPKVHCDNILDASSSQLSSVMNTVQKLSRHYIDNCGFSAVNVISNCGTDAGQSVMHMHIHIIPRTQGDNCVLFEQPASIELDLAQLAKKLAP